MVLVMPKITMLLIFQLVCFSLIFLQRTITHFQQIYTYSLVFFILSNLIFVWLSLYLYACLYVCMHVFMSVWCMSLCLYACLYFCMTFVMSVCMSVHKILCLCISLYVCRNIFMSVCMSLLFFLSVVCRSFCLYVYCLSIYIIVNHFGYMSIFISICLSL